MSLPLADQKLGSHSSTDSTSHKFMLKGRQSGGLHRGHAWVFRAESYDTMMAWFSDIKNLTEKTGEERNAFIRRTHARSVSGGSHRATSVSSDDKALDEDEADQVPYSGAASQADIVPVKQEQLPQRPNPGGRFPSALNIHRDSQVTVAPSSPSSTGDRDIVAAAGALPGSGVPFAASGHPVQASENQTHSVVKEAPDTVAPLTSPTILSPFQPITRHDSNYAEWMAPAAAGTGGAVVGVAAIHHADQKSKQEALPELSGSSAVPQQTSAVSTSQGAVFAPTPIPISAVDATTTEGTTVKSAPAPVPAPAAVKATPSTTNPAITNHTGSLPTDPAIRAAHEADPAAPIRNLAHVSQPGEPIKELAARPAFATHESIATISELHIPGEYAEEKS